jgi:hypothetical protein
MAVMQVDKKVILAKEMKWARRQQQQQQQQQQQTPGKVQLGIEVCISVNRIVVSMRYCYLPS